MTMTTKERTCRHCWRYPSLLIVDTLAIAADRRSVRCDVQCAVPQCVADAERQGWKVVCELGDESRWPLPAAQEGAR